MDESASLHGLRGCQGLGFSFRREHPPTPLERVVRRCLRRDQDQRNCPELLHQLLFLLVPPHEVARGRSRIKAPVLEGVPPQSLADSRPEAGPVGIAVKGEILRISRRIIPHLGGLKGHGVAVVRRGSGRSRLPNTATASAATNVDTVADCVDRERVPLVPREQVLAPMATLKLLTLLTAGPGFGLDLLRLGTDVDLGAPTPKLQ